MDTVCEKLIEARNALPEGHPIRAMLDALLRLLGYDPDTGAFSGGGPNEPPKQP